MVWDHQYLDRNRVRNRPLHTRQTDCDRDCDCDTDSDPDALNTSQGFWEQVDT